MCPRLQSLLATKPTPRDDLSPLLDIDLKILSPGEDRTAHKRRGAKSHGAPATSRRRCRLPSSQRATWRSLSLSAPYASHYRNREARVRRKPAEPHLEDGGIYRKRWWAGVDKIKNRGRFSGHSIARHGDRVRQRRLSSPSTSMPSTKLRMSALCSGNAPSCEAARRWMSATA